MRGADSQTGTMFSYLGPEDFVPPHHPLRAYSESCVTDPFNA